MGTLIDRMTSEAYKVLRILYEHRKTLPDGTEYVPMSQVELARLLNVSNMKMNAIFKQLDADDLVHLIKRKRGKYTISASAQTIIKNIENLENELEGVER